MSSALASLLLLASILLVASAFASLFPIASAHGRAAHHDGSGVLIVSGGGVQGTELGAAADEM